MGREQVEGSERREGHLPAQKLLLLESSRAGDRSGLQEAHRHKSLRAAESMLASAAPAALVIPCHTGGWHRRAVRPSLPTVSTPQMATNPQERKLTAGEHVERLQRVSSTPREIVRWAVWVLQSKPAAVMVFVGEFEMAYAQCPQAACTAHHPAAAVSICAANYFTKRRICVSHKSNQIVSFVRSWLSGV